ncbi:Programmed cell death 2 [Brachionus plicatilis]|uniref:Programmed cell death 2 n=1 Tax=Brachionus plicatilis TaxID=10195 RepID=A0A3M7S7P4_BRAPC|nr:Programmed cell death 2 [Brachionus plicatilis]
MSKIQVKKMNSEIEQDSDSDIDYDDLTQSSVDVGYIDTSMEELSEKELQLYRIQMKSPFFPNKVGGKPAWLDYSSAPHALGAGVMNDSNNNKSEELQCLSCKSQLVFLLQIYAPIGGQNDQFSNEAECLEDAFHRVLYVFLCSNQGCKARTFKAYRSQLNRENDFFSHDPPPEDYDEDDFEQELADSKDHLKKFYLNLYKKNMLNQCAVCGLACTKKCSRCNFVFFCSQAHQLIDWTKLNHKTLCTKYSNPDLDQMILEWVQDENSQLKYFEEKNSPLFPEREILIEPEELDVAKLKREKDKFKYDEKKIVEELGQNEGNDQDFDAVKENDYDKDFEKFKKISAQDPAQIIRYERGGKPLWTSKYQKLKESDIPKCEHCGSRRIFEFQVTPQLLCYLNLDESRQMDTVDWAGLYVYTCVKSCQAAKNSYASEFIYKQDFVS